ncbi:uncharacterized protein METZ01_LOCUS84512, partial [marine metagenome]
VIILPNILYNSIVYGIAKPKNRNGVVR